MLFIVLLLFPTLLLPFALSSTADANTLSATGGLEFGRNSGMNNLGNTNPLLGASYTFALSSHFELGGFYDYNFLHFQDGTEGSLAFMGMMVRYEVAQDSGFLGELKLGMGQASDTTLKTLNLPGYGVAVGYRFPLSGTLSVGPRVDLRYLPESPTPGSSRESMTDFSMMLSLHL